MDQKGGRAAQTPPGRLPRPFRGSLRAASAGPRPPPAAAVSIPEPFAARAARGRAPAPLGRGGHGETQGPKEAERQLKKCHKA